MATKSHIQSVEDRLYLVTLPVPLEGFDGFLGAWVYTGNPVVVVDVGPAVSAPILLSALSELGGPSPDLILLTHIHIDHAGGIAQVAEAFPRATVVCHPKGAGHLIDPERLWQGSLKTLGHVAKAYGPIAPIKAGQLYPADRPIHPGIEAIDTPGHAAHHYSYRLEELLFAGEAGGVNLPLAGDGLYLRPSTPPRFLLDTSLESIDRLLDTKPGRICYGHIGCRSDAVRMLTTHRDQLLHWRDVALPFVADATRDEDHAMQACLDHILQIDPLLEEFLHLPSQVRHRERGFLLNSIKGFWGYLKSMQQ